MAKSPIPKALKAIAIALEDLELHEIDLLLQKWKPDRIVWCDVKGLPYIDLWNDDRWRQVPKIDLWFDEPVSSVEHFGYSEALKSTAPLRRNCR